MSDNIDTPSTQEQPPSSAQEAETNEKAPAAPPSLIFLADRIREKFPEAVIAAKEWRGDLAVTVTREALHAICRFLRDDPEMDFDYIVHVSSVDWPDEPERFEVVYEVYSIRKRHRIRIKTRVPEHDCIVDSMTDIWRGAEFMEREVFDMMGIRFRNHPDLRRILMPDDYTEGYPLRKDFPLQGKGWRDTFEFLNDPAN
ncbi:MAG: NADH-quinone oxidoreductase subunit C [Nitrospirae bacterium]|nr:MAG: NADH-quinone oxidoreductase subunit C [Nitrospirota bacterium]